MWSRWTHADRKIDHYPLKYSMKLTMTKFIFDLNDARFGDQSEHSMKPIGSHVTNQRTELDQWSTHGHR